MKRVMGILVAAGLAGGVAGCSTSADVHPFASNGDEKAQLAAFAAKSEYPNVQASDDLKASAIVSRDKNQIKVVNSTDQSLTNVKVWVHGAYVAPVTQIPAHGLVTLERKDFYDRNGQTLADVKTPPAKIQLQTQDRFFNLEGPAFEQ